MADRMGGGNVGDRDRGSGAGTVWIRLLQRVRETEINARTGERALVTVPVDRVLSPYTGVDTPGAMER